MILKLNEMRKEEFNKCSLADKAMIIAEAGQICRQKTYGNNSMIFFKVHDFYVAVKFKNEGGQITNATAFEDPFLTPSEDFINYIVLVPIHAHR
ncbi:MAG: hypothetical protein JWN76_1192 [Chitinophagaceae bacterium]|nr:hypothetical protein [Chitinophagaceae bacterium]